MGDIVQRVAMKAVVVNDDGRVLILREASTYKDGTQTGRWHMPGGRVEPGEHFADALKREIREETGLGVDIQYPVYVGEWRPVIRGVPHQIVATFLVCRSKQKKVTLSEEHDSHKWISPSEHVKYDIMDPEGDVIDAFMQLQR